MNKISKSNKIAIKIVVFTLIALILGIVAKVIAAGNNSIYFASWKDEEPSLWNSTEYYCIEHQDAFTGGTWSPSSSETIRSDSTSVADRALAYILYEGEKSGNGGYNAKSKYQIAVWEWYYYNSSINESLAVGSDEGLYAEAMAWAENGGETFSDGNPSIVINQNITMMGEIGTVKVSDLSGTINRMTINWKDPESNKEYSQTINSNDSGVAGWIELYSDESCTKPLKVRDIAKGAFYIKNLKEEYLINNVGFNARASGSGFEVTITTYKRDDGSEWIQDLISADYKEGNDAETNINVKAEYIYGSIQIIKKGKNNIPLDATFKIYCETLNKWVKGAKDQNKEFVNNINDATEYKSKEIISKLRADYTYSIQEISVDNIRYSNPIYMELASSSIPGNTLNVLHDGEFETASGVIVIANKTNIVTITDKESLGDLIITKFDKNYNDLKLAGAEFRIYSVDKAAWVTINSEAKKVAPYEEICSYDKATTAQNSAIFTTDENGTATIKNLQFGKYKIYESKTPNGYDITKQDGYEKDDIAKQNHWVYVSEVEVKENDSVRSETKYNLPNSKIISLEGYIWNDIPSTKANDYNHIYDANGNDELLNTKVELRKINEPNPIATTDAVNGHYRFENLNYWDLANCYVQFIYDNTKYIVVNPFTGADNSINSKAQEYTIENANVLDDTKLTGTSGEYPGRAVTYRGQSTGDWTYTDILNNKDILNHYYNESTYCIENINLGLITKNEPDYSIAEELDHIKVTLNGYSYTYKYDNGSAAEIENGNETGKVIESLYVPTTSMQTLTGFYTSKIYPSDVAYNAENNGDKLKLYVVYRITVKNDETTNINDIYSEQKLYLNSLSNKFDSSRYELCKDSNSEEHASDFALWSETQIRNENGNEYGVTSYDVNNVNSVYRNGIEKNNGDGSANNAISSYIQFKMKDEALKAILETNLYNEEKVPTVTTANAYHDYLRTDNIWDKNPKVTSYNANHDTSGYKLTTESSKTPFVHKSVDKDASSYALYVHMKLGEDRAISGKVFEDNLTEKVTNNGKTAEIGNGIYDDKENNANKVIVELLNADKSTSATRYEVLKGEEKANALSRGESVYKTMTNAIETSINGSYSFTGIVPGVYYIRFTYGDGTQKLYTADGKEINDSNIKLIDYTSTKISSEIANVVKPTNKLSLDQINELQNTILNGEEGQKLDARRTLEWYKYIENDSKIYSTAADDLALRSQFNDNIYHADGTIDNAENDPKVMKAYTPAMSISIENDRDDVIMLKDPSVEGAQKNEYTNFNLGIAKTPNTNIETEKKITNVKLTAQEGSVLVSENLGSEKLTKLSDLDMITAGGSKYAKLEMDSNVTYGGKLEVTYDISITNNSDIDFTTEDWFIYGEITDNTKLKGVTIDEVIDELDVKYRDAELLEKDAESIQFNKLTTGNANSNEPQIIKITNWGKIENGETKKVKYVGTATVGANEDLEYINNVKVTQLELEDEITLKSSFEWDNDSTIFTITPPTGSNKDLTYYIVGAITLLILATGIVVLKKKAVK